VKGYQICPENVVRAELKRGKSIGARLIDENAPEYPKQLHDLPDAPPFLWCIGSIALLGTPMIALVGARNASSLGTRMAQRLAKDLGDAGITVVSGLARGVDAAAHSAALKSGTIAVQAGGIDIVYPAENTELAADIGKSGLRIAEMPIGMQPQARHFPARNRIIAGLAQAVVVVEAAAKSGSLITARDALDLGRDVLAVPGHPLDARAAGCNVLIRDGATLTRSIDDIMSAIGRITEQSSQPQLPFASKPSPSEHVSDLHQQILSRLGPSPISTNQLLDDLRVPAAEAIPALTELELNGTIERDAAGLLSKVD